MDERKPDRSKVAQDLEGATTEEPSVTEPAGPPQSGGEAGGTGPARRNSSAASRGETAASTSGGDTASRGEDRNVSPVSPKDAPLFQQQPAGPGPLHRRHV